MHKRKSRTHGTPCAVSSQGAGDRYANTATQELALIKSLFFLLLHIVSMKSLLLLTCVSFCAFAPACRAQGLTWTRITPLSAESPGARIGGAFGYDSVSNLFGGSVSGTLSADTWWYDVDSNMWEEVDTTSAPLGRLYSFYGVVNVSGESVFVVSHGTGADEYGDTWAFSFVTRQWSEVTTDGPVPPIRYGGHFGAVYGPATNEFWMGAGFTLTTTHATRYIDTYKLIFRSPTTATWVRVFGQPSNGNQFNPLAPHGRCLQGSAVVRPEQLVIFGGCMRYVNVAIYSQRYNIRRISMI